MCLVEDGRICRAVNLERMTRTKFSRATIPEMQPAIDAVRTNYFRLDTPRYFNFYEVFPEMLKYVTGTDSLKEAEIDLIVKPNDNIPFGAVSEEVYAGFLKYFGSTKTHFDFEHHLCHAYQAFLCSPFEECAFMSVDGSGERLARHNMNSLSMTLGSGSGARVNTMSEVTFPSTLGGMYSTVTTHLGFREHQEGNTMALAAFGGDEFYEQVKDAYSVHSDGTFNFDLEWKDGKAVGLEIARAMHEYCPPREPDSELDQRHRNVAWAMQKIAEDVLINAARGLHERTGHDRLAIAGGVGLNCVANTKMLEESPMKSIYICPNAGDRGLAAGAALYGYHVVLGQKERHPPSTDYLGRSYSDSEIGAALKECSNVEYQRSEDICADTAELISRGHIVGWFQGGAEFGPRALGHRSILGDPRTTASKKRLDEEIKRREWFRPYAPSVLAQHSHRFFDLECESPYMLLAADTRSEVRSEIDGVVHVDGSARIQTVTEEGEPRYHRLISEFHRRTDIPIVLNTSFNGNGEPIVETPENALATMKSMGLDSLSVGDYLVWPKDAPYAGEMKALHSRSD